MCTTKVCGNCKQEKPLEEFSLKNKKTGLRQSRCKGCVREYGKAHYAANTPVYVEKAALHTDKARATNAEYVRLSLVGKACLHCESPEDLLYYQGKGAKGQPVHMTVHAGLSTARVQEAIDRSHITCRPCIQKGFAEGFAEWGSLSHKQRKARQAQQTEVPDYKKTPGLYKTYRPVAPEVRPAATP